MKAPTVTECHGCSKERLNEGLGMRECTAYEFPSSKWRFGRTCPVFDGKKEKVSVEQKKINPLKASKRKQRGKA